MSRNQRLHQAALERLNRAEKTARQYISIRVDRGLTKTLDLWDAESPEISIEAPVPSSERRKPTSSKGAGGNDRA